MQSFLAELRTQRWDDHRFYHHSRINQSLHFLSAISFIIAYITMFFDPVKSALIGWLVSMVSRQSGHFFFEPKGYDRVNHATHQHKEEIKVGYNLRRKVILHIVWALVPLVLWLEPTAFGSQGGRQFRQGSCATSAWSGCWWASARWCFAPCNCFSKGHSNRFGVGDEDPHRSVQRRAHSIASLRFTCCAAN